MNSTKIEPKYISKSNPRVGLIALASDFMIERDFINVIKDRDIDFFVNRIECYNPLTTENLIKMSNKVTEVTKDILPDQDIDCVVYGCTSGTIAAGYSSIEQKIKVAKPMADVTTPSTAAIKALKKLNINKICLFTPYSKKLNDDVAEYFKSEGFEITSNAYFDIEADYDIGKVDQNYLCEVLSKIDLNGAEALFVSCTALPVLPIIDELEKKLNINKLCLFTPYSKKLNDDVVEYFKSEGFEITSNAYFDIEADYDIGKVDQNYLSEVLSKIDLNGAEALFVSCTALPVLPIIDELEKKLNTTVLSSNQALIWDTLEKINKNNSVEGFGKLFQSN